METPVPVIDLNMERIVVVLILKVTIIILVPKIAVILLTVNDVLMHPKVGQMEFPCTVNSCNPKLGTVRGECEDDDPCTNDTCGSNGCFHTPKVCNDQNACTTDTCENGACTFKTTFMMVNVSIQTKIVVMESVVPTIVASQSLVLYSYPKRL